MSRLEVFMKHFEKYSALVLFLLILGGANLLLADTMHIFRLLVGLGFGYTLSRAYTGFAGSVTRAYKTGSTQLMRTMMLMFLLTSALSAAFMILQKPERLDLWVNPINFGLIIGAVLFGFGMSFSACCASGVLTDLVTALPRALITLVFFSAGVFLAFPWQKTYSWITDSWWSTSVGRATAGGVFFPDWFTFDGTGGYLGALLLTALLCYLVIFVAKLYEQKRRQTGSYSGHFMEQQQVASAIKALNKEKTQVTEADEQIKFSPLAKQYELLFVRPWSLKTGAIVLAVLFTLLMGVTGAGWGASTPYGFWFGKALNLLGVSGEALAAYSLMPAEVYTAPFLANPVTVQNVGILLGTALYLLSAAKFKTAFTAELRINLKQACFYALGGLMMGVGTRLANGCNVGALYTPIANFSLSGWIFFVFMVVGGVLGNKLAKHMQL